MLTNQRFYCVAANSASWLYAESCMLLNLVVFFFPFIRNGYENVLLIIGFINLDYVSFLKCDSLNSVWSSQAVHTVQAYIHKCVKEKNCPWKWACYKCMFVRMTCTCHCHWDSNNVVICWWLSKVWLLFYQFLSSVHKALCVILLYVN